MTQTPPRAPRTFAPDDPSLVETPAQAVGADGPDATGAHPPEPAPPVHRPTLGDVKRGIRWGGIMLSAAFALASLAAGLWFARFVSVAIERQDWIGWTATVLMGILLLSLAAILIRELWGLYRLGRLSSIRRDANRALAEKDRARETTAIGGLERLLAGRQDCRWGLARLAEHKRDVRDAGDLLALADRDVVAPLDREARRAIMKSARRVSVVTALSPMMLIAVVYVLVENVRLLRSLAGIYGGRPGTAGALRLGRMVVAHLVATGSVALTEDLVGQFIGQDLLRRVSQRLGEGAFNGALTARIGAAAVDVIRPLPFIEAPPVRVRDLVAELMRKDPAAAAGSDKEKR